MAYQTDLSAEFYDAKKEFASQAEIEWYHKHLRDLKNPFLEAMCGSGRLLIPLCKKGLIVEGVDNSAVMVQRCAVRAQSCGIRPIIYEQSIEGLSLANKYGAIFIAVASFQLLVRARAQEILKRLFDHIVPGGFLLLDTYIPWDIIDQGESLLEDFANIDTTTQIEVSTRITCDKKDQTMYLYSRYTKKCDIDIIDVKEEYLSFAWYSEQEFLTLLQAVGFASVEVYYEEFVDGHPSTIYKAFSD
jgi:SAM-dependent methyltransferase